MVRKNADPRVYLAATSLGHWFGPVGTVEKRNENIRLVVVI